MESFLSRYKNILVLVGVLVAQIVGLAAQIRRPDPHGPDGSSVRLIRSWAVGLISPPERALRGMGRGFRGLWSNYLDLRNVRRQNDDLKAQVGRLQLEEAALLEDAQQGQRLQQILAFREHYIYSTVTAQVIGTSGTDQSRVLYIDKGTKDGLKPDMAVITPDGIVGKLKDVFSDTAQVLEISDQSSGAGVLLEATRLRGVLRGNALGQPQVINLLPDERIKPGEKVVTSGGDEIFPRGLPVGEVDHVTSDPQNPPFIDVVIKPAANLGHIEEVLVITQMSPEMPPQGKLDILQSAAVAGTQRAADILAQRLPGVDQPTLPPGQQAPAIADSIPALVRPPSAIHTDRYSPDATPPASDLTPGRAFDAPSRPLPAVRVPAPAGATASQTASKGRSKPAASTGLTVTRPATNGSNFAGGGQSLSGVGSKPLKPQPKPPSNSNVGPTAGSTQNGSASGSPAPKPAVHPAETQSGNQGESPQ